MNKRATMDSNQKANLIAAFKALGDENRLKILENLKEGEKCACDLLESIHIAQSTLSHHMNLLCGCHLVEARKEGKWMYYHLNIKMIQNIEKSLETFTKIDHHQFVKRAEC